MLRCRPPSPSDYVVADHGWLLANRPPTAIVNLLLREIEDIDAEWIRENKQIHAKLLAVKQRFKK
jgi:hypothetical protein